MNKLLLPCVTLLSVTLQAGASESTFAIRTFPGVVSPIGGSGDTERTATGGIDAFWLPLELIEGDGESAVTLARLTPEGECRTFRLGNGPALPAVKSLVRLAGTRGTVLLVRAGPASSLLYRLDPETLAVTTWSIPWSVTALDVSPSDSRIWLAGAGRMAELVSTASGDALDVHTVPSSGDGGTRMDGAERFFFTSPSGLVAFSTTTRRTTTWPGTGGLSLLAIDLAETIWGTDPSQLHLLRFDLATRVLTAFDLAATGAGWAGLSAGGGRVDLITADGFQLLSNSVEGIGSGTPSEPLPLPSESAPLVPERVPIVPTPGTATRTIATVGVVDRISRAEGAGGRTLFTRRGAPFSALLWTGSGETLVGGSPVEWWRPASRDFATEAVLPVVVSVRPKDPSTNYRTEVVLHNVDAAPEVLLDLRTSAGRYTTMVDVPSGGTLVFPDVIGAFVDRQTGVPAGTDVAGTLTARFQNGSGRMSARVFTEFGSGGAFPPGSTTGAAFDSVDPAAELFVTERALNGLRSSGSLRTNVGLANVCGAAVDCPALELLVEFRDDASGRVVSRQSVSVPARQWVQLQSPFPAASEGDQGSFSMSVSAADGNGGAAFDAYATVLDASAHDATFLRAASRPSSRDLVLPVAVDAPGLGTRFVTELTLTATSDAPATATVVFRSSRTGQKVSEVLKLEPGRGVQWTNAVDHFRLLSPHAVADDDSGPVSISFRAPGEGLVAVRTLSLTGTGMAFAAVDPGFERPRIRKRVTGLAENLRFRSNLAISNLGASAEATSLEVLVTVFGPDGAPAGKVFRTSIAPGDVVQWNRVLELAGLEGAGFTATIERTAGRDAFDAFVTVIDNATNDSSFLRAY